LVLSQFLLQSIHFQLEFGVSKNAAKTIILFSLPWVAPRLTHCYKYFATLELAIAELFNSLLLGGDLEVGSSPQ